VSTVLWWFARPWSFIWGPLTWQAITAAAILFFGGLWLGIMAEKKEITWATAWGHWILHKLEQWLEVIVFAGLNTGVMVRLAGGKRSWLVFLMPHSWIELPIVIASSAVALQASAATLGLDWFDILTDVVWARAFFLRATVPLLLGAAMLEAIFMVYPKGRE